MEIMKADAADAEARGETMQERMAREKAEWARDDAISRAIKENVS